MLVPFVDFGDAVWRADALGRSAGVTVATGHTALDALLPGGGWPVGAISEILQLQSGQHEWRLLLPALKRADFGSVVMMVGAPHVPFGPGLMAQGFDARRLLMINTDTSAGRLWSAEQALRCSEVAAVLAWLPQVRVEQLRRLQIAAHAHNKLLFVMRPVQAQNEPSPAVLRVLTSTQSDGDTFLLRILKRRGPRLDQPLILSARPARLAALMATHHALDRTTATA
jgi:protein ImuA